MTNRWFFIDADGTSYIAHKTELEHIADFIEEQLYVLFELVPAEWDWYKDMKYGHEYDFPCYDNKNNKITVIINPERHTVEI